MTVWTAQGGLAEITHVVGGVYGWSARRNRDRCAGASRTFAAARRECEEWVGCRLDFQPAEEAA